MIRKLLRGQLFVCRVVSQGGYFLGFQHTRLESWESRNWENMLTLVFLLSKLKEYGLISEVEYPNLRMFTVFPGLVMTDMIQEFAKPWAIDHTEMVGSLALYLSQTRADYLRGSIVSVNWDVLEMESQQKRILGEKMLKVSWLPALPLEGGKGLAI